MIDFTNFEITVALNSSLGIARDLQRNINLFLCNRRLTPRRIITSSYEFGRCIFYHEKHILTGTENPIRNDQVLVFYAPCIDAINTKLKQRGMTAIDVVTILHIDKTFFVVVPDNSLIDD